MEQELLARREQAESAFNAMQNSITSIKSELRKYGVETLEEAHEELMRLQGEYRLVNELISKTTQSIVSPEANVVDVDTAKKAKK